MICLDCNRETTLTIRGQCGTCGSSAVADVEPEYIPPTLLDRWKRFIQEDQ